MDTKVVFFEDIIVLLLDVIISRSLCSRITVDDADSERLSTNSLLK